MVRFYLFIIYFQLSIFLLLITACQPSATPSSEIATLEVEALATGDSLEDQSLSQITLLSQQIQQVRQLQGQFRKNLDSLYALGSAPEVRNQTDTLENIYFTLTDAETAWIVLRTQYPNQFDSAKLESDTIQDRDFESSLETVQSALSNSIERAERWRATHPKH